MRGFKIDRRGSPALERFFPARDTNTPAIAWFQPGKAPFGMRGDEVVSIEHGKIQELTCHLNANRMQSGVFGTGATIPIAIESGHRIAATAFQFCSKNVRWHWSTLRRSDSSFKRDSRLALTRVELNR